MSPFYIAYMYPFPYLVHIRRLYRSIEHTNIAYPVYTVIGELVVLIIIANKVIPTLMTAS